MHLTPRSYVFLLLTAVLAVIAIWSSQPGFSQWWRIPAGALLIGLAYESVLARRTNLTLHIETATRAFLGREQRAAFAFRNPTSRAFVLEYTPLTPENVAEVEADVRQVLAQAEQTTRDEFGLLPTRLGVLEWPVVPARLRGVLGLAWWSRDLRPGLRIGVAPDTAGVARARPRGSAAGARPRRVLGAGADLYQLRGYLPGDPPARIDWKATARAGQLTTREYGEDQHLDILVAIDAGRLSRIHAGRLDMFGLYANVAARFAEAVVPNDDRIGLIVFADRTLTLCPPDRGLPAVMRLRRALEPLATRKTESDPLAAAIHIRQMLPHRSLIVLLTDIDDASGANQLVRAVRLLSPPHLVVVAGVHNRDVEDLARGAARGWLDPWVGLAAQEQLSRANTQRLLLRRLGAPVIAAREELLERAVFAQYALLRRSRRV